MVFRIYDLLLVGSFISYTFYLQELGLSNFDNGLIIIVPIACFAAGMLIGLRGMMK